MQVFMVFCLMALLWAIYGYSLAFTNGNAFIGGFDRVFLQDMVGHHMMAVMMSQQFLSRSVAEHTQVNDLAVAIRDEQ